MLALWVFFSHPYWHMGHIIVICQENSTLKIFPPLTDTVLLTISL